MFVTKTTRFGTLYPASRSRTASFISSSVALQPGRSETTAVTASFHTSSASPTTFASSTAGCARNASSTSSGKTFSPAVLMQSEPRPRKTSLPSASSFA